MASVLQGNKTVLCYLCAKYVQSSMAGSLEYGLPKSLPFMKVCYQSIRKKSSCTFMPTGGVCSQINSSRRRKTLAEKSVQTYQGLTLTTSASLCSKIPVKERLKTGPQLSDFMVNNETHVNDSLTNNTGLSASYLNPHQFYGHSKKGMNFKDMGNNIRFAWFNFASIHILSRFLYLLPLYRDRLMKFSSSCWRPCRMRTLLSYSGSEAIRTHLSFSKYKTRVSKATKNVSVKHKARGSKATETAGAKHKIRGSEATENVSAKHKAWGSKSTEYVMAKFKAREGAKRPRMWVQSTKPKGGK